ncbi:MAG: hypothetical protein WKF81_11030 [Thermomicrobiales bacterium]
MSSKSPRPAKSRPVRQRTAPNKAQQKAAAVRAAQTHEDVFAETKPRFDKEPEVIQDTPEPVVARVRSGVRPAATRNRAVATRQVVAVRKLTREQEYGFIRADLRRLLITAGSLVLVMVVLLFVIEL